MKKAIAFLLVTVVCFSLCACDPSRYTVNREEFNGVIGVELIEYENPNQKRFVSWVPDHFDRLLPFVSDNATVLEKLPSEKIPDFLNDLSGKELLREFYAYDSPKDICIRLNYENGNFLIAWANYAENTCYGYVGEYSADGTVLSFWGCFDTVNNYTDLVNRYFTYKLQ